MLLGILLYTLAGAAALVGTQVFSDAWQQRKGGQSKTSEPAPGAPAATKPAPKPLTAAEKREAARRAFVEMRQPLQEAVMNTDGTLIAHEFGPDGMGEIEIPTEGGTTVPISKDNGIMVWVYNNHPSIRRLLRVGSAERHEPIDVTDLPLIDRVISLPIGDSVVIDATDGSIIQLLLVDAHVRVNGDQIDDARFRYEIYPPGTSQVHALRNGKR